MISKGELRQKLRQERQMLNPITKNQQEQMICHRLANLAQWQNAQYIFAYLPTNEEVNLAILWQAFPEKKWLFPRCDWHTKKLTWHIVTIAQMAQETEEDKYQIPLPKAYLPTLEIHCADLVLVPTIASDRSGYRLGYGGGFYDRCLRDYAGITIGVVFQQFLLEQLPHDPWDIRLKMVVSDLEVICP